ncbi:MAG: HD domain-containing protein, partial [Propionibacteriaceae bacterium]
PGPLTPAEFATIQGHAAAGAHILAGGESELLRLAEQVALTHHERWDGTGYPRGLIGDAIPLAGRLVAVVDVFDALTSRRPYKAAWTPERAASHMLAHRARHFDPELLDVFLAGVDGADQSAAATPPGMSGVASGSATVNTEPAPGRLSTSR